MRSLGSLIARFSPESAVSPILWFAVLGAPASWAAQLLLGYWLAEAECSPTGDQWGISLAAWGVAVSAAAALVAAGAGLTALLLHKRSGSRDAPPPKGRIAFLAIVGMTVSSLFLVLVAMTAAGILTFDACNQS